MGMKHLPKRSGEYLFEIIMRRYETRATMMTSNRPLEDWGKLIGDVPSATAILDRFLHHAEIVRISGKSYRRRRPPRRQISPHPCGDQGHSLPSPGPPASLSSVRPTADGSNRPTGCAC